MALKVLITCLLLVLSIEGHPQLPAAGAPQPAPVPPQPTTTAAPLTPPPAFAPVPAPLAPVAVPLAPVAVPSAPAVPLGEAIPGSPGKFAVIFTQFNLPGGRPVSWQLAQQACATMALPPTATASSLFTVNNPSDSTWLSNKLLQVSTDMWVGLKNENFALRWVDGTAFIQNVAFTLSGHDDPLKPFAMASPDTSVPGAIKYEFLSATDEADGYFCQYRMPTM